MAHGPPHCPNRCRAAPCAAAGASTVAPAARSSQPAPSAHCGPRPRSPVTAAQSELAERFDCSTAEPGRLGFVLEFCTSFPTATCVFNSTPASSFPADEVRGPANFRGGEALAHFITGQTATLVTTSRSAPPERQTVITCPTKPHGPVNSSSHFTMKIARTEAKRE